LVSKFTIADNVLDRVQPPLENYFGNMTVNVVAIQTIEDIVGLEE
jgi:hypothetical protein